MSSWVSESQKLGVIFCSGGALFLLLGVMMFFDRALLSMGNILFLLGVGFMIGIPKTIAFFRRAKWHGTLAFGTGIFLILARWAFVGFVIELYGLLILFGGFFATIATVASQVPIIGPILSRAIGVLAGAAAAVGSQPAPRTTELPV